MAIDDIHPRPLTICRLARPSDEAALFELVQAFPTPSPPARDVFTALFLGRLDNPRSYVAVVEVEEGMVGYVAGDAREAFYAGGEVAFVEEVFVVSTHRMRGIGKGLMAAFEAWAEERGCKQVALATGGAGLFYERLGYESRARYYKKYLSLDSPKPPSGRQ